MIGITGIDVIRSVMNSMNPIDEFRYGISFAQIIFMEKVKEDIERIRDEVSITVDRYNRESSDRLRHLVYQTESVLRYFEKQPRKLHTNTTIFRQELEKIKEADRMVDDDDDDKVGLEETKFT